MDLFEGKPLRVAGGVMAALLEKPMSGTVLLNCHMCHFHGTVVLAAVIASTGRIVKLQVVSGPAMLRGAAIDAVRQWRYRPYLLNGSPVAVQTTIVVPVDGEGD
ncbi:MAG: energy transducer TonB [Acidobacteriota bacterium]